MNSDGSGKIRVAFLNTHPIQYFTPLYAYLNGTGTLSITALYLSDSSVRGSLDPLFGQQVKWDVDQLAGYDAQFIGSSASRLEPGGFFSMMGPGLWKEINRERYDALVVHGHTPAANLVAIAAAKRSGVPVFMRCETHLGLARSWPKRMFREPLLALLYNQMAGVLAIGSANAAFYKAMHVADRKIFAMPYCVDNERFAFAAKTSHSHSPTAPGSAAPRPSARRSCRSRA